MARDAADEKKASNFAQSASPGPPPAPALALALVMAPVVVRRRWWCAAAGAGAGCGGDDVTQPEMDTGMGVEGWSKSEKNNARMLCSAPGPPLSACRGITKPWASEPSRGPAGGAVARSPPSVQRIGTGD
jgi:MYXO-CTERM domain-containing protein